VDSEFNNDVFKTIDARLQGFAPPIKIADYIDVHPRTKHTTLDPKPTTLDGINFRIKPKMRYVLEDALTKATVRLTGERAFAGKTKEDQSHWGLRLSFAATNGTGFREIWRMPPLSDRPLSSRDRYNTGGASEFEFDPRFGSDINAPDVTSLHCAPTRGAATARHRSLNASGFSTADRPTLCTATPACGGSCVLPHRTTLYSSAQARPSSMIAQCSSAGLLLQQTRGSKWLYGAPGHSMYNHIRRPNDTSGPDCRGGEPEALRQRNSKYFPA
jgi:hypothetical protein